MCVRGKHDSGHISGAKAVIPFSESALGSTLGDDNDQGGGHDGGGGSDPQKRSPLADELKKPRRKESQGRAKRSG